MSLFELPKDPVKLVLGVIAVAIFLARFYLPSDWRRQLRNLVTKDKIAPQIEPIIRPAAEFGSRRSLQWLAKSARVKDSAFAELSLADQARLRRLAVFAPSGFTPDGLSFVWWEEAPAVANALEQLVRDGWLVPVEASSPRYRVEPGVVTLVQRQLSESGETHEAHLALAAFLGSVLTLRENSDAPTAEAVAECDNLRRLAQWAVENADGPVWTELVQGPHRWVLRHGTTLWDDWQSWLSAAATRHWDDARLRVRLYAALSDVHEVRDEHAAARVAYDQALTIGAASFRQWAETYRVRRDQSAEAHMYAGLCENRLLANDRAAALQAGEKALGLFRDLHDQGGQAKVLVRLGELQQAERQFEQAAQSYAQAREFYWRLNEAAGEFNAETHQSNLQLLQDQDVAAAETRLLELVERERSARRFGAMALTELLFASVLASLERWDAARQHSAATRTLIQEYSEAASLSAESVQFDQARAAFEQAAMLLRAGQRLEARAHVQTAQHHIKRLSELLLFNLAERLLAACDAAS